MTLDLRGVSLSPMFGCRNYLKKKNSPSFHLSALAPSLIFPVSVSGIVVSPNPGSSLSAPPFTYHTL